MLLDYFCAESQNDGKVPTLLNWKIVHQKFPWSLLFLIGGGFALADACTVRARNSSLLTLTINTPPSDSKHMTCVRNRETETIIGSWQLCTAHGSENSERSNRRAMYDSWYWSSPTRPRCLALDPT